MKKVIILQPGKLGDLVVSSPIIDFYNKNNFDVEWIVFDDFVDFFERIRNVKTKTFDYKLDISYYTNNKNRFGFGEKEIFNKTSIFFEKAYEYVKKEKPDLFLDICWGFPGSSRENNEKIFQFYKSNRNWIDMRYFLAKTPLKERWNFSWIRDEEKEDKLLNLIKQFSLKKYGSENFSIIHNYNKNEKKIRLENQIELIPIPGFQIYDWIKVLENAQQIACVDSSLCNFVEVVPSLKEKNKIYLGSEEPHYYEYMRNILLNNWVDVDGKKIVSDYESKI